ncbi:GH12 family glycosyl hydrolase domain-containing protein [Paenibacillus terrae]
MRKSNTSSASFNIKNFTNYMIYTKKWMSNAKFVSSVEFGTEIFGSSGSMNISKWNVNVQ